MQAFAGNPPAPGQPIHYIGPYDPGLEPVLLALDRRSHPWENFSRAHPGRVLPGAIVAIFGVAANPATVAGYVVYTPPDAAGIARIHWICAHPTYGGPVFAHLDANLQGAGLAGYEGWVTLSPAIVAPWDIRALRFFVRTGFHPVAQHFNPPAPAAVAQNPIDAAGSTHILMRMIVGGGAAGIGAGWAPPAPGNPFPGNDGGAAPGGPAMP
jgi:hypothetical protein